MSIKEFNPTTPSRRYMTVDMKEDVTAHKPFKALVKSKSKTGGRNNTGRITCRFRGGGHKKAYRLIDFKRDKKEIFGKIETIEYDPNRTSRIALVVYTDGERRYIIAPLGIQVGDKVVNSENADIKPGNVLPLKNMPDGTIIHNIEINVGKGGQIARSAGSFAQIMGKEGDYSILKMPSGELRRLRKECCATVGQVGNIEHENIVIGKAGRYRWMGWKPRNRSMSMNPCDHPMGGGEGKSKSGQHPMSPTGVKSKGFRTRDKKKTTGKYIIRRRKA
ncbi:MAG: 50S ribosomal protein L2 [bacterium]